jgi:hypothetical protein
LFEKRLSEFVHGVLALADIEAINGNVWRLSYGTRFDRVDNKIRAISQSILPGFLVHI